MTKHKRFNNNPKSDYTQNDEKIELVDEKISSQNTPRDFKSILLSGTKYAYILAAAAFLSGIFTPLTIGADLEIVLMGILTIFLGLGGGIVIFLGVKHQKFTTLMICGGLGMMSCSLILIHELANRSFF
tara:strand:- start:130 stop:516 length:387 start_codon:yes stop_codon:yes gene_type:complete